MKELKAKLSRYLSVILMAAMIITGTPQAAMAAVEENPLADPVVGVVEDDAEVEDDVVSQADAEEEATSVSGEEEIIEDAPTTAKPAGTSETTEPADASEIAEPVGVSDNTGTASDNQIEVTFAGTNFTVQCEIDGVYSNYNDIAPLCVSGGSLNFTVSAETGYDIVSVSCADATVSANGNVYTIDLEGIDEDITIDIDTAAQPLVTFNTTGIDNVSYNTTGGTGDFIRYSSDTPFPVSKNTVVFFKVTPDANHKAPISVSAGNVRLEKGDNDLYSQSISENTTFTVKATPIQHTVKFDMTGVSVLYKTVSTDKVFQRYVGTPISIPNGEIYFQLNVAAGYEDPTAVGCDYDSESKIYSLKSGLTSIGQMTTISVNATPMKTVTFRAVGTSVIYRTVSDAAFQSYTRTVPVPKDRNFFFQVAPEANYTTPIAVSENGVALVSENGIYCVSMNHTSHVIDVIATPIMYQVSFNCVSGNFTDDGIQYTIEGTTPDTKYSYNQSLTVQQCKTVKFKLNLNNAYEKPVVKAGDLVLTADRYGVYKYVVTNNTDISITASKKPAVFFKVATEDSKLLVFDDIEYKIGTASWKHYNPDEDAEIPIPTGNTFYYRFSLKDKYDAKTLSVKIVGVEQTPNTQGEYQKSNVGGNITIVATAKATILDVAFENPTEAMIETISGASVPDVNFKDNIKKISVEKNDDVKFKVFLSGNYVGRRVVVKAVKAGESTESTITPNGQGEYTLERVSNHTTIEVLPDVKYTFTNSQNAITFSDNVKGPFGKPNMSSPDAVIISQNNIASGKDYFFKVTPASGKAVDYVKIGGSDGKVISAEAGYPNVYKVNAKVDTAIEVKSDTAYKVKFVTDNGAVVKVGKDKEDKDYSETLKNNDSKVIAGAEELRLKAQAADSYEITSVSVNGATAALKADKEGVYSLPFDTGKTELTVTIMSEKQKHKVTFVNAQRATIQYTTDGTIVSSESSDIIDTEKETVKDVVAGSTFMVTAPDGSQIMRVVKGKDKAAVEMTPNASGIYTIQSLNADETITVICRKNATGIKYDKNILTENDFEQIANTVETYRMEVTGVDENFNPERDLSFVKTTSKVGASVSWSKVDYKTVNVEITTPYDYTGDSEADLVFDIKEGSNLLATVKVISTKPILKAPSVAVSDIRDDSAVLTLTDNSKQVINDGKVYYHISATQQISAGQIEKVNLSALNDKTDIPGLFTGGEDGKDIYVPADTTSKKFTTKVEVNFRPSGDALVAAKGFNVSVNACISRENGVNKVLDDSASTNLKKNFNLNASKYETNLKLGKVSSKFITGQAGVPIAKLIWSRGTTHREFDDLYVYSDNNVQNMKYSDGSLVIRDDIIYLKDTKELSEAGTYTVVAQPESKDSNTNAATLKFKVVRGIEKLDSANKNISILRAKGKKVTYKLPALIYNEGKSDKKPTSKKVTYTLSRINPLADAPLTANDKLIKVANGKITIDKKYVFDAKNPVTYKVTVKANDFIENDTKMAYTFTIKETGVTSLKYLYICRLVDNQFLPINVNAAIGSGEYYIIATKGKAGSVIAYNSANIIMTSEYSMKCSNSNVCMESDVTGTPNWEGYAHRIDPKAYAKDVTFTATAVDGSKTEASLKKVTFEEYPDDLWFDVYTTTTGGDVKADHTRTVSILANETFNIQDYAKFANSNSPAKIQDDDVLIDYKVKADKGLKIVNGERGSRQALFTGKTLKDGKATGTLTYTYYKLIKGKRTKTTEKLTIVNDKKWVKTAAPSAKQRYTLYAEKARTKTIGFKVTKKLPTTANMVRITKVAENNDSSYANLYHNSSLKNNVDSAVTIYGDMFNLSFDTSAVKAGTYKYIMTYGHKVGTAFIEDTAATTLTIKVTKESAKLETSYIMSEVIPSVALTGKFSEEVIIMGTDLVNANIGGTINHFTDYFELSTDKKSIVLKASEGIAGVGNSGIDTEAEAEALQNTIEYLTNKANKNELVGYLSYGATNSKTLSGTIKITVKVVTNAKSASAFKSKVKAVSVSGTNIKLMYNKKDTKYAQAYTNAGNGSVSLNATIDYSGNIMLSGKTEDTGNVKNAYVYVLKTDSPYVAYIRGLKGKPKYVAMMKYGVKVKLGTIRVK